MTAVTLDLLLHSTVAGGPSCLTSTTELQPNWANLSATQRRELHYLMRPSAQLATARALRWREDFYAFYDQDPSYTPEYLRRWCYGAKRSRLQPIKDFVTLVEKHWDGIIAWHKKPPEQRPARRHQLPGPGRQSRVRGYRSKTKMITIVYLAAAKLQLPSLTSPTPAYMPSR